MNKYYESILPELLKRELGVHNWADDRGGPTAHGVTEKVANRLGYDLSEITHDIAMEIFKSEYYDVNSLDDMPDIRIAWRLAVDGLHSGARTVAKRIQLLSNLTGNQLPDHQAISVDGKIGPNTLAAIDRCLLSIAKRHTDYMNHNHPALRGLPWHHLAAWDLSSQLKGLQFGLYYELARNDTSQMKWFDGWLNRIRFEPDFYAKSPPKQFEAELRATGESYP